MTGLKGSGKTYIGNLLSERLNIPFLRVEDIFLKIKTDDPLKDQNYISAGFKKVEDEIRKQLLLNDQISFESTGIAPQFREMVQRLNLDFCIKMIKIETDPALCMERIRTRDQSVHIFVSDDQIIEINKRAMEISLNIDLVILNNDKSDDALIQEFEINLLKP